MLGLVRIIATLWLIGGAVVFFGAAALAAVHYLNVASPLPINVVGIAAGAGFVVFVIGWKMWDAAVGEKMRVERSILRRKTAAERAQRAEKARHEATGVWHAVDAIIGEHLATLRAKRGELVKTDDYGQTVTESWDKEIEYFWERVVRPTLIKRVAGKGYREALQQAADWSGTPESRKSPDHAMREVLKRRVEERLTKDALKNLGPEPTVEKTD